MTSIRPGRLSFRRRTCGVVVTLAAASAVLLVGPPDPSRGQAGPVSALRPASAPTDPTIARIRDEGLNRSQVMATLDQLCNVIGPRLTASPGQLRASGWTRDELARWGLAEAHVEPWGPFGRGWSLDRFSMRAIVAPTPIVLDGYPKAWSPGFDQPIEAEVVYVDARKSEDLKKYKGKLAGKVVLFGVARPTAAHFRPQAVRMTDDELAALAADAPDRDVGVGLLMRPATAPAAEWSLPSTRPAATEPASRPTTRRGRPGFGNFGPQSLLPSVLKLARDEGAILVVDASGQGDGGTVYVASASVPRVGDPTTAPTTAPATQPVVRPKVYAADTPPTVPQVTLAAEDFNRLVHMAEHGEPIKVAVDLHVTFTPPDPTATCNTVAELPGTDLKDQIVMVGGHLDSWQVGTGATDNAAGSASAMEAIRILKALDLHPRRTIRVALWTGEEEGLLGSAAYVKRHFATPGEYPRPTTEPATEPATRPAPRPAIAYDRQPEYEHLSVYFNLDNGSGRIRGIYAQGNRAAVPLFRQWLAPFADLGAETVTLADTGSTDHISFDAVGLPGFQFIQDPIEYGSRTHHSTADVYDRLQPDDLKQASTIMAAMLWDAANTDDRFPRKPTTTTAPTTTRP